ncbi:nuclear receptor-binding protein isoform X2 [Planococcus citri]
MSMVDCKNTIDHELNSSKEVVDDSEDESEIVEESPCGRWLKRREEVDQRDVPGIDNAFLAMDTEEGVEVVWNEVQFSERKNFKAQEDKIRLVFENLTKLTHPNIVKFHRYWTDTHNDQPRVIFITEYMSSGCLKQFLKRTKRNVKKLPLHSWRRWCRQILSALSYLHSCNPPIVHGYLTCDTIFIQHNGLVKIGSVAPDTIHHHVKTCRDKIKNVHFIAPEYGVGSGGGIGPPIDIYSFGMCALEMAALEIHGYQTDSSGNELSCGAVTEENIDKTIESLEEDSLKDFIRKCLSYDPAVRPTARQLLFHPLLFEVHSLKLLAAHALVQHSPPTANLSEIITERMQKWCSDSDNVLAVMIHDEETNGTPNTIVSIAELPVPEKLEKFVEDVKNGVYPLTAHDTGGNNPIPVATSSTPDSRTLSPERISHKNPTTETQNANSPSTSPDRETRKVINMMCNVKPKETNGETEFSMTILLRMEDKMNRQLTCTLSEIDTADTLVQELIYYGFINETDKDRVSLLIEETLKGYASTGDRDETEEELELERVTSLTAPSSSSSTPSSVASSSILVSESATVTSIG